MPAIDEAAAVRSAAITDVAIYLQSSVHDQSPEGATDAEEAVCQRMDMIVHKHVPLRMCIHAAHAGHDIACKALK